MFELTKQVSDLNGFYSTSTIYSYECISKRCNIDRDVWIQYYKNETMETSIFSVGDSINMMGDVPTILLYVENLEDSNNKTYNVYRYKGELQIDRKIVGKVRHDILKNLDEIVNELKSFLVIENKQDTPF